jgi:hypothetical protein
MRLAIPSSSVSWFGLIGCGATALLNHLIGGGQQRFRDGEGLRGLEVDDEFEFGGLFDRQIGWFLAFESAPS